MLNPEAPAPLYRQLADDLEERIYSGQFGTGERIPSEHELAATHQIGRPTVRQATDYLVRRGLLERRRGSGTFVAANQPEVDLFTLAGTNAAFEGAGLKLRTALVKPVAYWEQLPSDAGPLSRQQGYAFSRIGRVGDDAVLLEELYLDAKVFPRFDAQPVDREPLSRLVDRHYHRRPSGGNQTLRAQPVNAAQAALLDVEAGISALLIERTLDFVGAKGAIFTRILALTDRVVLAQSLSTPLNLTCVLAQQEEKP